MVDPEKVLSEFMATKNREALGEKAPNIGEDDDNYMTDNRILTISFTDQSVSRDDKAMALAKKIMTFIFAIPLLIGAMFTVLYFLLKIAPSVLFFIRGFFLGLGKI
ncbi:MAG: hypothetical protein LBU15_04375 [Rickettsiales bacterium]|jgi:hypothetical protein|nr:hypothetical protein [Rickettsiales bacterium]